MQYIGQHGMVRPRDIEAIGLPREYLVRLHQQGKLNRPGRGIYTWPDATVTERHSYAEVAKRFPEAVICLLARAYLSRDHHPKSRFGLHRPSERDTNAHPHFAFPQDRPPSVPSPTEGTENHRV